MGFTNSKQYNDRSFGSGSALNALTFFLIGGGIGAAIALLFAPKSGADLRSDISEITKKGYDETLDLAHQLKEQSADVYQSLKEKTDKVYSLAAERLSTTRDAINNSLDAAGQRINGELREIDNHRSSITARRGSDIV